MGLILTGLKKTVLDAWDELIFLIMYNLILCLTMLPAIVYFISTFPEISMLTLAMTGLLLLPSCLFLFAMFEVAFHVNKGNSVNFFDFFQFIRHSWQHALIWGAINLIITLIFMSNLKFYGQFVTNWAGILQFMVLALFVVWWVLQLVMLPMYPHLNEPGLKIALRNSLALIGRYSLPVLVTAIITGIILGLTVIFQFLAFFFTFFAIVMLCSSMLTAILDVELDPS
jgi:hypothetical protein